MPNISNFIIYGEIEKLMYEPVFGYPGDIDGMKPCERKFEEFNSNAALKHWHIHPGGNPVGPPLLPPLTSIVVPHEISNYAGLCRGTSMIWGSDKEQHLYYDSNRILNFVLCENTQKFGTSYVLAKDIPGECLMISSGRLTGCMICCLLLRDNSVVFTHTGGAGAGAGGNYLDSAYSAIQHIIPLPNCQFDQANPNYNMFQANILNSEWVISGMLIHKVRAVENKPEPQTTNSIIIPQNGIVKVFKEIAYRPQATVLCIRPSNSEKLLQVMHTVRDVNWESANGHILDVIIIPSVQ
jgi:hypothetical protein